jgi:acetylornithine deacetylase
MDIQPDRLKTLLKHLIDIYSPSGKEEELLEFVQGYLEDHGLHARRQEVDEHRYNLVVFPESSDDVELCFVAHVDTVTAFDIEDYAYYEEGGTVYGLGAADMKAGCAAMIEAFTALARSTRSLPSVGLALVVGEEEENDGAKALLEEYTFPWAILGEPTDLVPCLSHYGYLEVALHTQGKRAHSSMPELGQNAIEAMLLLLLRLTEYVSTLRQGLVYNIRELSSYPGGFVVPDTCDSYVDLHLPPNSRIDNVRTDLEELMDRARQEIPNLDAQLRFEDTYPGYQISPDRPLVRRLRQVYEPLFSGWQPQSFRSHSDGNVLWAGGVDPIVLGPGRLEAAHTPEESISFQQVEDAARLYLSFLHSFLLPPP